MIPPRLRELASALARGGARLEVILPDGDTLPIGAPPARARVRFHDDAALAPLLRSDHLGLAEAYLAARVDIEGDPYEVVKVTDVLDLERSTSSSTSW